MKKWAVLSLIELGSLLVVGGSMAMGQPRGPDLIASIKTESSGVPMVFTPDGKTLTMVSGTPGGLFGTPDGRTIDVPPSGQLTFWDVATKNTRGQRIDTHCSRMGVTPDGKVFAMAGLAGLTLFDPITRKSHLLARISDFGAPVLSIAFSPNGKLVATGDLSGKVKIWDVASRKLKATLAPNGGIGDIAFFPDGKTIAAACDGVYILDIDGKKKPQLLKGYKYGVRCLAISPDGKTLATPGDANEVWLWDVEKQRIRDKWKVDYKLIQTVAFSRDGRILVAAGGNGNLTGLSLNPGLVTIWDANTGKQLSRFKVLEDMVGNVALSPDGKLIAVSPVASLRKVNVWDISRVLPTGGRPNN